MDEFEEPEAANDIVPVDEADYLQSMNEDDALPTSVSAQNIDKNSRLADATPNIKFTPVGEHDFPIVVFCCLNPVATIVAAKKWLVAQYDSGLYETPEVLRMERQEVERVNNKKAGKLLLLEQGAWIEGREGKVPVAIMALVLPGDPRVRFWYSIFASFKALLLKLDENDYIRGHKLFEPKDSWHHDRLYVWMREEFLKTLKVPEHPDFLHAESMTDFSPEIPDPDNAIRRIEACEALYNTKDESRDLSDDRYLLHLHPAEREIASQIQVSCAEYLLIKRNYFKDWYVDVYRSDKKVKDGEIVRTNYAHEQYLERVYEWTVRRSRRLIAAWKALGLLDQSQLAPWVMQGGMLAESVAAMSEEEVRRLQGVRGGQTVAAPRKT